VINAAEKNIFTDVDRFTGTFYVIAGTGQSQYLNNYLDTTV
jgi:hypothetical protein